jgi:hypothetical protein
MPLDDMTINEGRIIKDLEESSLGLIEILSGKII